MKYIKLIFLTLCLASCHPNGKNGSALTKDGDSNRDTKNVKKDTTVISDAVKRNPDSQFVENARLSQPIVIKTGADHTIISDTLKLDGSKSTGGIKTKTWSQVKGTPVAIVNPNSLIAYVYHIPNGDYTFKLTLTDGHLKTVSDTIHIIKTGVVVVPPPINKPPTVNAGADQTITWPANVVTLKATATDPENGAILYKWNEGSITSSITKTFTGPGNYGFSVIVTDNKGLTAKDSVTVFVNPAIVVVPPDTTGGGTNIARHNLTLESTFEAGYSGWNITDQTCCSYSATLSSDFARKGGKSMRIELRRGDPLISSSARSEIEPDAGSSNSATSEAWYGFSMYVPSDWFVSTNPESPIQFHQQPNVSGSEPVGLWIDGANWEQMITKGLNVGNTYVTGPPVIKGAWTDVVMHIKWDAGTNGIVQTWINGVQFCDYHGITNFPGQGYYAKVGAYKWYWQDASTKDNGTSRIYYFDEFRIGTAAATYNDVAPSQQ